MAIFAPNSGSEAVLVMIGHVVGPHWYLYRVPESLNMLIVTIFLDPIWPQLSQISQNHDILCSIATGVSKGVS